MVLMIFTAITEDVGKGKVGSVVNSVNFIFHVILETCRMASFMVWRFCKMQSSKITT